RPENGPSLAGENGNLFRIPPRMPFTLSPTQPAIDWMPSAKPLSSDLPDSYSQDPTFEKKPRTSSLSPSNSSSTRPRQCFTPLHALLRIEVNLFLIALSAPDTALRALLRAFEIVDLMLFQMPLRKLQMAFQMPEKKDLMPFHAAFQMPLRAARPTLRSRRMPTFQATLMSP